MAKWVSLIVKFGALIFIILLPLKYAIQLQLLGGILICQTFPAVVIGLYTRLDPRALLAGWAVGMISGTVMAGELAFKSSIFPLELAGWNLPGYAAFYALILNLAVAGGLTLLFNVLGVDPGGDQTVATDYLD